MKKTKTVYVNEEDWQKFKDKYPNISERLEYLIKLDLENKLDTSQSPQKPSIVDRHSRRSKTD